jgi:hypothetical protein
MLREPHRGAFSRPLDGIRRAGVKPPAALLPGALRPLDLLPIAGRRAAPMLDLLTRYLRVWPAWSLWDQWLRRDACRSGRPEVAER